MISRISPAFLTLAFLASALGSGWLVGAALRARAARANVSSIFFVL